MTLSPEMCLRGVIETLQHRITPALTDNFTAESARLAGLILTITTNGIDNAAAIRIAENDAMRALFRDAAPAVDNAALAAKLAAAGSGDGTGYKLSELDADNAQLRARLVELHFAIEKQIGGDARAIDRRIWRMLKDFEAARAPRR
jgi:hypothetical protein